MMFVPLAAAVLLWVLLTQTHAAKRVLRLALPGLPAKTFAILLVVAAMLVAAHGNLWAALCLFGASLWSLGRAGRTAPPASRREQRSARIATSVSDDGRLQGHVLSGRFAGFALGALDERACRELYADCLRDDPAGARLLEAYFDRRFAGWRPAADGDADARRRRPRSTNEMTEEQAYQVLGLGRGSTRADIVRSHRLAMKKWHPDQGGSADLAALANEAKEVLLRHHV